MKDYWLYLYPETFLFIDEEKLLLYHSRDYTYLEVDFDPFVNNLYINLTDITNAYCAKISEEDLLVYSDFIAKVKAIGLGDLVQSPIQNRPVSYPPVCKINTNLSVIQDDYMNRRAGYIIDYLRNITIYLTSDGGGLTTFYKQTIYPIKGQNRLAQCDLLHFMDYLKGRSVDINVVCDPKHLIEHELLFQSFKQRHRVSLYFLNSKLSNTRQNILIPDDASVFVICNGNEKPVQRNSYSYIFLITNESEFTYAQEQASLMENAEIVPIYTGNNLDFFKDNVFTTKGELFSLHLTKRKVFAKQQLNTNFFGKLTILPSGNIYSNLHEKPLGTIKDSLYEMLYKELTDGYAWMLTRDKKEPCVNCRFKFLCPPISNYEFAIGKFNLCHLRGSE
ncbi:MAG: TIGR04150 pseudo-rSAM protein [Bacteroidales bacterium]|nr:TIGR04150 pseudo-rSAM protein [Bacteroidales bacterium]